MPTSNRRRRARAFLALAVVATLVVPAQGTNAVSSVTMDREAVIEVVDSGDVPVAVDGYIVDVSPADDEEYATENAHLVAVTNNLDQSVRPSASVTDPRPATEPNYEDVGVNGDLAPGETGYVDADVVCDDTTEAESVEVTVEATTDDPAIETTATAAVACRARAVIRRAAASCRRHRSAPESVSAWDDRQPPDADCRPDVRRVTHKLS
jgi:hypothetical protein